MLFSGTIRSNLDPFSLYEDSRLWDALQRSYLTGNSASHRFAGDASEKGSPSRFTLDTAIEGEGANLSVGERSLLSLARALVKDSKLVIMDEATWALCKTSYFRLLNIILALPLTSKLMLKFSARSKPNSRIAQSCASLVSSTQVLMSWDEMLTRQQID